MFNERFRPTDPVLPRIEVAIVSGDSPRSAVKATLDFAFVDVPCTGPNPSAILVPRSLRHSSVRETANMLSQGLADRGREVCGNVMISPDVPGWRGRFWDRTDWVPIHLPEFAERRDPVRIPRQVAGATRYLVSSLPGPVGMRKLRPIQALASFAHPRQRLASFLDASHSGVAAEIALALRPRLVLLIGDYEETPISIVTTDIVAAELLWLALAPPPVLGHDAVVGPWEDPVVQRATEIDLGVRLPDQLVIRTPDAPVGASAFLDRLVERAQQRLGITSGGDASTSTT
jgi:hypothetical protein